MKNDKASHTYEINVIHLCVIQGVKNSIASWPQLILPVCNAASDWPCTFLCPGCFYLAQMYRTYLRLIITG